MEMFKYITTLLIFLTTGCSFYGTNKVHNHSLDNQNKVIKTAYQKILASPVPFIQNTGQVGNDKVRFYSSTNAGNVYVLEGGEIVYVISGVHSENGRNFKTISLRETLIGATPSSIKGEIMSVTQVNYFVGSRDNWKSNIPAWESISLGKVYDGIELKLRVNGTSAEKIFYVNQDGKVEDIRLKLEGLKGFSINDIGELEIETEGGNVKFTKPYAYQEIDGKEIEVKCEFSVSSSTLEGEDKGEGELSYGFRVASYNKDYPLVIDPLLASTLIGGGRNEKVRSMTADSEGNIFITGLTKSSNYPVTADAYDKTFSATYRDSDVIVSKFESSLSTLLSSTFIGGNYRDVGRAIALDSDGNVFITGRTRSTDFPTTSDVYDTSYNNTGSMYYYYDDIFVSKLDNSLSTLLSSTYIGGNSSESGNAIALDSEGNVYITGYTYSDNFPVTSEVYDNAYSNTKDVIIFKLDNSLKNLLASTFLGGELNSENSKAIAIDTENNVFIAGNTKSSDFPVTEEAYDTSFNVEPGDEDYVNLDGFVAKLDSSLSTLISSTFIGGTGFDYVNSLALDSQDNIFVTGKTAWYDFPVTEGAFDTSHNGEGDIFVSKFDNSLTTLMASTFLGGSDITVGKSLIADTEDNIYVTGYTYAEDYPTTAGAYRTIAGYGIDTFASKLDNSLSEILSSTLLPGNERNSCILIDSNEKIYIAGETRMQDYPTTKKAYDNKGNGRKDIFISKLDNQLSTGPDAPQLKTGDATAVKAHKATLNGIVNGNGLKTKAWFEYGQKSDSLNNTTSKEILSDASNNTVSIDITGLSEAKNYHYRLLAENSIGKTYGNRQNFTTKPEHCDKVVSIEIRVRKKFFLRGYASVEIPVTLRGISDCPVEGKKVTAEITMGGDLISIKPQSAFSDEEGKATFTITGKNGTGAAMVVFKAGDALRKIYMKISAE